MKMAPEIKIDPEACDGEAACVRVCAEDIFVQVERGTVPTIAHPDRCFLCGQCVAVCPGDAITHHGFEMANFSPLTAGMELDPEALQGFLRLRRSVRNYHQRRPVPRKVVEKLLEAARYAPTGSNVQSLKHIIIESRQVMDQLAALCVELFKERVTLCQDEEALSSLEPRSAQRIRAERPFYERVISDYDAGKDPFFYQAPVLIVSHADLTITPCPLEDATLASYHMMLMAQSLGLGTCYIGNFYEYANESQTIREMLAVPADDDILMSFTLGYPAVRFRRLVDRKQPVVRWFA